MSRSNSTAASARHAPRTRRAVAPENLQTQGAIARSEQDNVPYGEAKYHNLISHALIHSRWNANDPRPSEWANANQHMAAPSGALLRPMVRLPSGVPVGRSGRSALPDSVGP